ncbi:Guanine nucleotide-exchange factor S12 [Sticta canariensis]|nr:Guanine nucleotide-exchange factor S12 [Sticta canariensis]
MADESMLTYLLRGPDDQPQSFLEGIFSSTADYKDVTEGLFGRLSNDDHNALRRTNSTMNHSLMERRPNGRLKHKLEHLRDTCDVFGWSFGGPPTGCENEFDSSARLTRCSRQEQEPGFAASMQECHRSKSNFLVCSACDARIRQVMDRRNRMGAAHWPVCHVCAEAEERKHPQGARLCDCIANVKRRVLCEDCAEARVTWMTDDAHDKLDKRNTIWRDETGEVRFDHRPGFKSNRCLGCGVRSLDWEDDEWDPYDNADDLDHFGPRICVHCRKYTLGPRYHPPIDPQPIAQQPVVQPPIVQPPIFQQPIVQQPVTQQPIIQPPIFQQPIVQQPIVQQPIVQQQQTMPVRSVRRSARLNPFTTQATAHLRLSYHGTARRANTESQGRHGFSSRSS